MVKKPFSVRVEENVTVRFRALSAVLNVDSAKLLDVLVREKEKSLTSEQEEAYRAVLKVWKSEDTIK